MDRAVVSADCCCPYCALVVKDEAWIQWGRTQAYYRIGDDIEWLRDRQKRILPHNQPAMKWAWFSWGWREDFSSRNYGYPSFRNLIAIDLNAHWHSPGLKTCSRCNMECDGWGIIIQDGRIASIRSFELGRMEEFVGEKSDQHAVYILNADGTVNLMRNWEPQD